MKKITLLSFLLFTIITSCSTNSSANGTDKLPEGYWVDEYKTAVVYFNDRGNLVIINRDNQIVPKDKFEITEITSNHFSISANDHGTPEINQFNKASNEDFFLGKWHGVLNNKAVDVEFVYSSRNSTWELFEETMTQNGPIEEYIPFEFTGSNVMIDNKEYEYQISDKKNRITFSNGTEKIELTRGHWSYEEKEKYEKEHAFDSETANLRSGAMKEWIKLVENKEFGGFSLDASNYLKYKNSSIQGLSETEGDNVHVSPANFNNQYAFVFMGDEGLFLIDLENRTAQHLDIYAPNFWLSYSPNSDFVILHHYYEADGKLYMYNLNSNELHSLNFDNEFGEGEQMIFNLEKLSWTSESTFEIPATINCNPYFNIECGDHSTILRSKKYVYDIELNEIINQ